MYDRKRHGQAGGEVQQREGWGVVVGRRWELQAWQSCSSLDGSSAGAGYSVKKPAALSDTSNQ